MLTFKRLTETTIQAQSDRPVIWKCNGIIAETENNAILIDCNFDPDEMIELKKFIKKPIAAYFVTHMHIDHVNNLHVIDGLDIPIYAPIPEDTYIVDINQLFKYSGTVDMNMEHYMKKFTTEIQGFREVKTIIPFIPGTSFSYDSITIETIALPGHSPGHSGFIIHDMDISTADVLFAADIGLDGFGAWYGFKNASLIDYRCSLQTIRSLYTSGNFILTSSHNDPQKEKDPAVFDSIIEGINKTESRLMEELSYNNPVLISEITLTGIYYRISSINKMNDMFKQLYFFWEYYTLLNHLNDLESRGITDNVDGKGWTLESNNQDKIAYPSINDQNLCIKSC